MLNKERCREIGFTCFSACTLIRKEKGIDSCLEDACEECLINKYDTHYKMLCKSEGNGRYHIDCDNCEKILKEIGISCGDNDNDCDTTMKIVFEHLSLDFSKVFNKLGEKDD